MYLLYVTKIFLLALLKISYGIVIHLSVLLVVMAFIALMNKDKLYFRKIIDRLLRGAKC